MKKIPRIALILIIIFANIGCDQITKDMARKNLEYHESVDVIGDYLVFIKVENEGAFLGMGSSLSPALRTTLLLILPCVVMIAVFVYLIRNKNMSMINLWALSFIVGGGIGNIYDRLLYGQVTDMLFLDFKFAHTGIFNMADVSVMVGTGLILLDQFLPKKKNENEAELQQS
ncbi:signal peptidase II [Roseivirga sp.]|uniref:signal peptidase II n=1 Tax=Roseivirga sp. TaxID=1964215 RepID=UPI003B51C43C